MRTIEWGLTGKEDTVDGLFKYVPKGWHSLVEQLVHDLFELGWDGQVLQVKEKFGGLRFYIGQASPAIYDRIEEATDESYVTCERTGKPGKVRNDLSWIRTLCEEEYLKEIANE